MGFLWYFLSHSVCVFSALVPFPFLLPAPVVHVYENEIQSQPRPGTLLPLGSPPPFFPLSPTLLSRSDIPLHALQPLASSAEHVVQQDDPSGSHSASTILVPEQQLMHSCPALLLPSMTFGVLGSPDSSAAASRRCRHYAYARYRKRKPVPWTVPIRKRRVRNKKQMVENCYCWSLCQLFAYLGLVVVPFVMPLGFHMKFPISVVHRARLH